MKDKPEELIELQITNRGMAQLARMISFLRQECGWSIGEDCMIPEWKTLFARHRMQWITCFKFGDSTLRREAAIIFYNLARKTMLGKGFCPPVMINSIR